MLIYHHYTTKMHTHNTSRRHGNFSNTRSPCTIMIAYFTVYTGRHEYSTRFESNHVHHENAIPRMWVICNDYLIITANYIKIITIQVTAKHVGAFAWHLIQWLVLQKLHGCSDFRWHTYTHTYEGRSGSSQNDVEEQYKFHWYCFTG